MRLGLDIRDLGDGLSYRRLRVILENSAPDSAFAYATSSSEGWSTTDYLLATIADYLGFMAHGYRLQGEYQRIKRPGVDGNRIGNGAMTYDEGLEWYRRRVRGEC